jgi:DNA helicase HerA-like ATPase
MDGIEGLGVLYIGRPYDLEKQEPGTTPILYDAKDLVTHAVCVGMTGSGKTGLCVALIEEAVLDGIPAVIVDPKGDLAKLLLLVPDL